MGTQDTNELEAIRKRLAVWSLRMTTESASGHPSSCLSASHVVTALYFGGLMNFDASNPTDPGRDRFIMSKGHAAPILYAALAERGAFPTDDLLGLRKIGNRLEGHPNRRRLPGVEASTGSLGQGLSVGLGAALAARLQDDPFNVWVLTGDGELNEGQIWEAAMGASKYATGNLVAIVDRNGMQQTGAAADVMPMDSVGDKFAACGWHVQEIDGHDWTQVMNALTTARDVKDRPAAIVAKTVKGYGVSRIVKDPGNKFHGVPIKREHLDEAIADVEGTA